MKEKREFFQLKREECNPTKPQFDYTSNQILCCQPWSQVFVNDPETPFYPEKLPAYMCSGVDFLRSNTIPSWDLAVTLAITRRNLQPVPASSCRHRILNILKRRFAISQFKQGKPKTIMDCNDLVDLHVEIVTLCGVVFSTTELDVNSSKPQAPLSPTGCLKQNRLEINSHWLKLVKSSPKNSCLRNRLEQVISTPHQHIPLSRRERIGDESIFQEPTQISQKKSFQGKLSEIPSAIHPSEFAICYEYPGRLKRDPFAKVSFKWSTDNLDFHAHEVCPQLDNQQTKSAPLKIDSIMNKNVFLLPTHDELAAIGKTVFDAIDEKTSVFVQPNDFSKSLTIPTSTSAAEAAERASILSDEYSLEIQETAKDVSFMFDAATDADLSILGRLVDQIGEKHRLITGIGHFFLGFF